MSDQWAIKHTILTGQFLNNIWTGYWFWKDFVWCINASRFPPLLCYTKVVFVVDINTSKQRIYILVDIANDMFLLPGIYSNYTSAYTEKTISLKRTLKTQRDKSIASLDRELQIAIVGIWIINTLLESVRGAIATENFSKNEYALSSRVPLSSRDLYFHLIISCFI